MSNNHIYHIDQNRVVWFDEGVEDTFLRIEGVQHQPATVSSANKPTWVHKIYKKNTRGKAVRRDCQDSTANAISAEQSS